MSSQRDSFHHSHLEAAETDFISLGSKITVGSDCSHEIKRHLLLGRKAATNPDSVLKKQRHHFADKAVYRQSYGFSNSHVWMWELDHKEGRAPKNWCFQTMVLENTLENPLDSKEVKPINPKGNQPWIFTGRTVTEAEAPILWPPDAKSWLLGKDPDAGKVWKQEEKGMMEDEMVGWHHRLTGHGFEQTPGDSGGLSTIQEIGKPGVLQSMGLQIVGHAWVTEQNSNKFLIHFGIESAYLCLVTFSLFQICLCKKELCLGLLSTGQHTKINTVLHLDLLSSSASQCIIIRDLI